MNVLELAQAGAIVSQPDPKLDSVSARAYRHPALGERKIIRLVADTLGPAEDLTLEFHGFAFEDASPVGHQLRKGLGFPGWALVNDPEHAAFALEVVKLFRAQAKLARSRPGAAKDGFDSIAQQLGRSVPHFLPSFYEEAARVFLEHGNSNMATMMFGKARQAEKVHALKVDETLRRDAFLEFALAGAVSIKTLTEYSKDLSTEHNPQEAYHHFRELCLRRTLGGMPPWSSMLKELKRLAKAAELDVKKEERTLLEDVLEAPAVARAPIEFWSSGKQTIAAMCKERPELRQLLLNLVPHFSGDRHKQGSAWLDLLDEWGALKLLEAGPGATAWFQRMMGHFHHWSSKVPNPDQMFAIARRAAEAMKSEDKPIVIVDFWRADLDLIELLLSLGVPVAVEDVSSTHYRQAFNLPSWAGSSGPERPKNPVHLSAHEGLRDYLMSSLDRHAGSEPFDAVSAPMSGWKTLRRIWLERQVEKLETEALPTLHRTLEHWESINKGRLLAEYPKLRERLQKLSRNAILGRSLRGFVPEELAWPALEKAIQELGPDNVTVDGLFPVAVVSNAVRAIAVGHDGEIARHDLKLPKGSELEAAAYIDGQFLFRYWAKNDGRKAVWSSGQECELGYFYRGFQAQHCAVIEGVGVTFGGQAIQAGDPEPKQESYSRLVSDGQTCWRSEWSQGQTRMREFDPRTGNAGRFSWPKFFEDAMEPEVKVNVNSSYLFPLPKGLESSPLGAKGGLAGWRVRQKNGQWEGETIAGGRYVGAHCPQGLVTIEQEQRTIGASGRNASFEHDGLTVSVSVLSPDAPLWKIESHWWHLFAVRDTADSRALRGVSDSGVDTLKLANPVLVQAHRKLVEVSQKLFEKLATFLSEPLEAELPPIKGGQLKQTLASLRLEIHDAHDLSGEVQALNEMLPPAQEKPQGLFSKIAGYLGGGARPSEAPALKKPVPISFIAQSAGHLAALAWRCVAPFSEPAERESALALLSHWADSGLVNRPECYRRLRLRHSEYDSHLLALSQSGNRYLLESIYTLGETRYRGFEASPEGKFHTPKGAALDSAEPYVPGWETHQRLKAFVEAAETHGGLTWNPQHPARLAELTGLSLPEACLLWAGFPNFHDWQTNFLPTEVREAMGLKSTEAKVARENLRGLLTEKRLAIFAAAIPEEPSVLWTDTMACVERLGEAWNRIEGRRLTVTPEVLKALGTLSYMKPAQLLPAFTDPGSGPFGKDGRGTANGWNVQYDSQDCFTQSHLQVALSYLAYLFENLPVGDPLRQTAAKAWPWISKRLQNPNLMFYGGSLDASQSSAEHWKSLLGGTDNGKVLMQESTWAGLTFFYRPAKVEPGDPVMTALSRSGAGSDWSLLESTRQSDFLELISRFDTTPVKAGDYETNPSCSVPALVDEVQSALQLSPEEATLYLQTLALLEPTSKNVQLWNGWTAAVYKKAAAGLTDKGLLLEAKRSRAGRSHFLPGGWLEQKSPQLPFETWKVTLYGLPAESARPNMGHIFNLIPTHRLFERAWARVQAGDTPAYEEVRKS